MLCRQASLPGWAGSTVAEDEREAILEVDRRIGPVLRRLAARSQPTDGSASKVIQPPVPLRPISNRIPLLPSWMPRVRVPSPAPLNETTGGPSCIQTGGVTPRRSPRRSPHGSTLTASGLRPSGRECGRLVPRCTGPPTVAATALARSPPRAIRANSRCATASDPSRPGPDNVPPGRYRRLAPAF